MVKSAVVWGKAKLRINGIWMPVRFKAYYLPGQAFLRYLEVTWFGKIILKVSDSYISFASQRTESRKNAEGGPWSYWTVEDVEYNIDVTGMINETQELGRVMR